MTARPIEPPLAPLPVADGTLLGVRPLTGPADLPLLRALLESCDPIDRIRRAGTIEVQRAAGWLLPRNAGDPREVALAAVAAGEIVGVVNVVRRDALTGEIALIVVAAWRRRGVAAALVRAAAAASPHRLVAVIEPDNRAALRLAGSLGAHRLPGDDAEFELAARAARQPSSQSRPDWWRRRER